MQRHLLLFVPRLVISAALFYMVVWIYAPKYLQPSPDFWDTVMIFSLFGMVFAALNTMVKPFLMVTTLSAGFLSMMLFMIVINYMVINMAMFYLPNMYLTIMHRAFGGIIISLANYLITSLFDRKEKNGHN